MIIKVLYSKKDKKIYITSKPSHRGQDRQHAVDIEQEPTKDFLLKMQGNEVAFFHAHLKEDLLVIDDRIDDQQW
jgi:hypothetical protein